MRPKNKLYLPNIFAFSLLFFLISAKTYCQGSPESKFNSSLQDFNVSTYTGAAMVNIPIYTFSEGGINIPISLSCNTSGIRVDEKASFVGLGWTLNAGGMISRMTMGSPDEGSFNGSTYIKGYYKDNGYYSTNVYDDHEPDQFFMNVGGTSIRFMFAENGKVYTIPASDVKIEPHLTRINYSGQPSFYRFTDFTVTMPDGTKYIFGTKQEVNNYAYNEAIEKSYSGDISQGSNLGAASPNYIKNFITRAWMLTKIISPNGFAVVLDYSHDRFKNISMPSYQAHANSSCSFEYVGNTSNVNEYVDAPVLEAITGTNIKIEFRKQNSYDCSYVDEITNETIFQSCSNPESFKREDLFGWGTNAAFYGRILKNIRVQSKVNNAWENKLTYSFEQSYFRADSWVDNHDAQNGNTTHYQPFGPNSYRLRLDKIIMPDNQELSFNYYENTINNYAAFPGLIINALHVHDLGPDNYTTNNEAFNGEYAKDHWGYFNGFTGEGIFGSGECQNSSCFVRNRTANSFYSSIHSLKTITSNRGTETTFLYELHDANNYKDGNGNLLPIGGNRIAKIISKDLISGISTVKKYQYKSFSNNALSSGFLVMKPVYRFSYSGNYGTASGKVFGFNDYLYLSALSQLSRPYISYKNITESIYSTTGDVSTVEADNRLLATNKFTYNQLETEVDVCSPSSGYGYYPNLFTPKIDYESQNLIKSESYTKDNKLASVMEMEYGLWSTSQVISGKRYLYLNDITPIESQKTNYSFTVYHAYLKRQVQRNYDYSGNNYTEDEVKYFYKNDTEIPVAYRTTYPGNHYQVVKTTTKDSKGNIIENWNKYAGDFNFGVTSTTVQECQTNYVEQVGWTYDCQNVTTSVSQTPTDNEPKAIKQLLDRNMIATPIETFTKRNNKIINASYINYHLESSPKAPLPKESYRLKLFPLDSFTEAKWTGSNNQPNGTIDKSPNYVLSNTVNSYNAYGLPTETKVNFGAKTTMTYQANDLLPYQTTNAAGTAEAQTSTVTFDSPIFGVTKQTAPNGIFTTNVYETGTGRLIKVLDRFGNIIKHIEYKPKGQ